jgi:hypothetical protein
LPACARSAARSSSSRRLSERSAQGARSEFAAQAGKLSIAGNPCAAGASTRTRQDAAHRAFARSAIGNRQSAIGNRLEALGESDADESASAPVARLEARRPRA